MSVAMENSGASQDLAEVVRVLELNLKYIASLGLDAQTVTDYRKVILFLRSRNEQDAAKILERAGASKRLAKSSEQIITIDELTKLNAQQLTEIVKEQQISRKLLEHIARHRFSVSSGAISSLRTVESLREKLLTLLAHEHAHGAIERLAARFQDKEADA